MHTTWILISDDPALWDPLSDEQSSDGLRHVTSAMSHEGTEMEKEEPRKEKIGLLGNERHPDDFCHEAHSQGDRRPLILHTVIRPEQSDYSHGIGGVGEGRRIMVMWNPGIQQELQSEQ